MLEEGDKQQRYESSERLLGELQGASRRRWYLRWSMEACVTWDRQAQSTDLETQGVFREQMAYKTGSLVHTTPKGKAA